MSIVLDVESKGEGCLCFLRIGEFKKILEGT